MHDLKLATKLPSVLAAGVVHVALKIYEQIKKKKLVTLDNLTKLLAASRMDEDELVATSRVVLRMAQDFDTSYPQLCNLRNTHFTIITKLMDNHPNEKQKLKDKITTTKH